jgi:hypothetical protein
MLKGLNVSEILEKEGFEEVDELDYKKNIKIYNFFYTFDETELEAGKDYANENYDEGKGEDQWYEEFFLPYLTDIAGDNIKDIVDELCEKNGLVGEFVIYEIDKESYEQVEVTIALAEEGTEFDMEKVLEDLEL